MAKSHKLTIRVEPHHSDQALVVSGTGRMGTQSLSFGPVYVQGQGLITAPDRRTYWQLIMNQIAGNIPV